MKKPMTKSDQNKEKFLTEQQIRRRTIKGLIGIGLGITGIFGGLKWANADNEETPGFIKKIFQFNSNVSKALPGKKSKVREFRHEEAVPKPRVNGDIGILDTNKLNQYVFLEKPDGSQFKVSMEEIKKLPKTEITFEFKCIEGWSEISNWGGTAFSEFMNAFQVGGKKGRPDTTDSSSLFSFGGFETPDGKYYVGLDMDTLLHPQTLLCYEMNQQPLSIAHGAPVRLIVPTKYGIKSLKSIGRIYFSDSPPKDYWAENGYDYDSSL